MNTYVFVSFCVYTFAFVCNAAVLLASPKPEAVSAIAGKMLLALPFMGWAAFLLWGG